MGKVIGKDCCCNDWKSVIKQLWENYQDIVKSVKIAGTQYYPDGDGMVNIPGALSDGVTLTQYPTYYNLKVLDIGNTTLYDLGTYYAIEVSI